MYVTLKEARAHLQLDDYFHDDDALIEQYVRAAENALEKRVNRPLSDLIDRRTGELQASTKEAVLLLVGHFYNQREATTVQNLRAAPLAWDFLADLDRKTAIG